jgi:hypothetical protein
VAQLVERLGHIEEAIRSIRIEPIERRGTVRKEQPWDSVIKQARIAALKQVTIANNPKSKYVITPDFKNGKLLVSLKKGGMK